MHYFSIDTHGWLLPLPISTEVVAELEISEENQIELSRLECKEYLDYTEKTMTTDELDIRVDSTQSHFLQRSLKGLKRAARESPRKPLVGAADGLSDGNLNPDLADSGTGLPGSPLLCCACSIQ